MTRVWLPDSPEAFGGLPAGIEADVWNGGEELPSSADEVEFVVFPFGKNPEVLRKIVTLPRLTTIQILSAGADHILPYIPANITLCNARGAHTPATAEWTAGVIIASIRNFPRFAAGQQAGHWDPAVSDLIAGKRVLIVGYGSIGEAVERRLAGWEVEIVRVARHARDGVHPIGELPNILPTADVVVILVPVTDETRQLVNAEFLKTMKDGALLVNAARGVIVDTDALLAELTSGRLQRRARRHRPGAAAGRPPALVRARPAAHPARRRRGPRLREARLRNSRHPARPARGRPAAAERHRHRRILRRRGRILRSGPTGPTGPTCHLGLALSGDDDDDHGRGPLGARDRGR